MISALVWVPKGASRRHPEKLKLTDDEMKMLSEAAIEEEVEKHSVIDLKFFIDSCAVAEQLHTYLHAFTY